MCQNNFNAVYNIHQYSQDVIRFLVRISEPLSLIKDRLILLNFMRLDCYQHVINKFINIKTTNKHI